MVLDKLNKKIKIACFMNQEEFDYFCKSIVFQREIEEMDIREKLNYIIGIRNGFNHKFNPRYIYFNKKLSIKIAEENIYEMEIKASLMKSLEETPEEELDEVRDNIIDALLATREELYTTLLRYVENEEFFDTENDHLLSPSLTLESLSMHLTENMNPINHSYFFDYSQNNNQTSTKISEEEDEEMEEGAFVIHGVDIEHPFIGDLKGAF